MPLTTNLLNANNRGVALNVVVSGKNARDAKNYANLAKQFSNMHDNNINDIVTTLSNMEYDKLNEKGIHKYNKLIQTLIIIRLIISGRINFKEKYMGLFHTIIGPSYKPELNSQKEKKKFDDEIDKLLSDLKNDTLNKNEIFTGFFKRVSKFIALRVLFNFIPGLGLLWLTKKVGIMAVNKAKKHLGNAATKYTGNAVDEGVKNAAKEHIGNTESDNLRDAAVEHLNNTKAAYNLLQDIVRNHRDLPSKGQIFEAINNGNKPPYFRQITDWDKIFKSISKFSNLSDDDKVLFIGVWGGRPQHPPGAVPGIRNGPIDPDTGEREIIADVRITNDPDTSDRIISIYDFLNTSDRLVTKDILVNAATIGTKESVEHAQELVDKLSEASNVSNASNGTNKSNTTNKSNASNASNGSNESNIPIEYIGSFACLSVFLGAISLYRSESSHYKESIIKIAKVLSYLIDDFIISNKDIMRVIRSDGKDSTELFSIPILEQNEDVKAVYLKYINELSRYEKGNKRPDNSMEKKMIPATTHASMNNFLSIKEKPKSLYSRFFTRGKKGGSSSTSSLFNRNTRKNSGK